MLDNMHKFDLSGYNMQVDSLTSRVSNVCGIGSNTLGQTNEVLVTIEISMPMAMTTGDSEEGFNSFLRDVALLNKIKNNNAAGVKEQYDKLLTIFALAEDY